jgi:F-type H+-transporting ATPase subunit b
MLIAQAINFAILLGALTWLLYKPVLNVIDQRRMRIEKSMEQAKLVEKQAAATEKERMKRLKETDDETKAILKQTQKEADAMKKEMLEAAKTEATELLEKGRKQLEDERRKLLGDLQSTVISIGVKVAEKILEREFNDKDQQKLLKSLEKDIPTLIA